MSDDPRLALIAMESVPLSFYVEKMTGEFLDYTWKINRRMFETATRKVPYKWKVSDEWLDRIARYPERFRCEE